MRWPISWHETRADKHILYYPINRIDFPNIWLTAATLELEGVFDFREALAVLADLHRRDFELQPLLKIRIIGLRRLKIK